MNPFRGILLKIGSVVIFVMMAALIKASSGTVPPGQQVFFRSAFAMPVILIWLIRRGELPSGLRAADPMGHVWRGLVGTAAMGFGFAGLGLLPLPEVTAIGYAAPLLVVIFAAMFLGEEVRLFRLSAVALGMIGVLIVLSPNLTAIDDLSAAQTLGAVVTLIGAILAALAQILLTSAYRYADASLVAPFEYASILFALAIGYAVFEEIPSRTVLIGAAIVIAAGILIIWRERQLGIERSRQRKAMTPQG